MGAKKAQVRAPLQGVIDVRPSGSRRVRVDAGVDPVTGKRYRLVEHVPAGTPNIDAEAEKIRVRLVNQVNESRQPRTNATVSQLLDRYLDSFDGAYKTLYNYRGLRRNHVEKYLGKKPVRKLDADAIEKLYAELRRCRHHCTGPFTEHRTTRAHSCDDRCRPHQCRPLGRSAIHQIHWLLHGAFTAAKRWNWVSENPVSAAVPGRVPRTNPQPPSAKDAARIIGAAAEADLAWATLIWLAMTTGARRHELCALRWTDVLTDHDGQVVLWVRRGISSNDDGVLAELDTKTHQQRRVTLDPETVAVLMEHRERISADLRRAGAELAEDAFVFSAALDHSRFRTPDSVTQRYRKLVAGLGINTTIHKLRHYSATELIKAGVDVNTVAGRLGHAGGGTTTLRFYTGWIAEAEQRAAISLGARMPERNWPTASPSERAMTNPRSPYEKVAAAMRQSILDGRYADGALAPSVSELAAAHQVSIGTAHRVLDLLKQWGLLSGGGRGNRHRIVRPTVDAPSPPHESARPTGNAAPAEEALDLDLVHHGQVVRTFRTTADPGNTTQLLSLLVDTVRRVGPDRDPADYELVVRYAGERGIVATLILPPQRRPAA